VPTNDAGCSEGVILTRLLHYIITNIYLFVYLKFFDMLV
jgi:hypothetical protein